MPKSLVLVFNLPNKEGIQQVKNHFILQKISTYIQNPANRDQLKIEEQEQKDETIILKLRFTSESLADYVLLGRWLNNWELPAEEISQASK